MKRVPKTVKIGCHDYEVVQQKRVFHDDGDRCNALIDIDGLKLFMERALKRQKKQEHIFHESLHGIFNGYPFEDDELEERIVAYLAPRLLQLIQDNSELVEYLQSK